tara:strand:+ start:33714 stop:34049 length:336 start_codon:yes stop_codon:yes gene_type:complete
MSLAWDITKVEDHESKCWIEVDGGKRLNPTTESLIWECMAVGLQEITRKNAEGFYTRHVMLSDSRGCRARFTLEDIKAHVGLWTNVSKTTKSQFNKKVAAVLRDRVGEAGR